MGVRFIHKKIMGVVLALLAFLFVFSQASCAIATTPENTNQTETKQDGGTSATPSSGDNSSGDNSSSGTPANENPSDSPSSAPSPSGEGKTGESYASYNLASSIEDGAILHAFCWSFNTIKENLQNIKDAGFSAVQTSPVSKCRAGYSNDKTTDNPGKISDWYYHYQPTEYVIGNYQLGTEAEFKAMCDEAHTLGIKIIVDAVMNHCTSEDKYISPNIKALAGNEDPYTAIFHDMTQGTQWVDDRYNATQKPLGELIEWNTQSKTVQNYLLDFLKNCVKNGADGFRYDAARHIELPDDNSYSSTGKDFQSDFWPTVLQNGSSFQYGEILQDYYTDSVTSGYDDNNKSGTRIGAYQAQTFGEGNTHFRTTASHYGNRVRNAIENKNLNAKFLSDFLMPSGAKEELCVTWVESHDNYYNDQSYEHLTTEQQVILGYALIASRANGTPLFFDRPTGATSTNKFGSQYIGKAGSDIYKDAQVKALNFFRNAMAGTGEILSNPISANDTVLMIQRGGLSSSSKAGFVIVNASTSQVTVSSATCALVADGTYTDEVSGNTFTVSGGKVSGKVKANSVAVVFAKASGTERSGTTASIEKNAYPSWQNFYCYAYYNDGAVKNEDWPGEKITVQENGVYTYTIPKSLEDECIVIFNNGSGGDGNQSEGFYITKGHHKILTASSEWKDRE